MARHDPAAEPRLARVLVIGAGLMVRGRLDPHRTRVGADFSSFRTYCDTKLALAVAQREVARRLPELDVLVLHPGVVRTDLGARTGLGGRLLSWIKRSWESPEACAARVAVLLRQPERWSSEGGARWQLVDSDSPWPAAAASPGVERTLPMLMEYALPAPTS